MLELVQQLTSQLGGVDENQAKGGAGLIMKLLQEQLSSSDFSKVQTAVPGTQEMIQAAPAAGGGGLMGALGGIASAVGGEQLGQLASLAGGFQKLGISPQMIAQFLPILLSFVQQKGGDEVANLVKSVLQPG